MSNHETLQTAVIAFEQWRNTRTHRAAKTPISLRQHAVKLLPHYPISQIIQALKLSHSQLKFWANGSSKMLHQPQFVALPETNEAMNRSSLTLEWQFADGVQCRLSGEFSAALLNTFVQTLSAQNGGKA